MAEEHKKQQPNTEAALALSVDSSTSYAAIIDNRAKEVGVAVLHLSTLKLSITQFIEAGRSYTTTQLLLDACNPRQVVLVGTQHHEVSGGVNSAVAGAWDHVLLPRSCFDDTKGILAVQELTGWSGSGAAAGPSLRTETGSNTLGGLALQQSHYLGFGAAGALLHYLKHDLHLALSPRSIQVEFEGIKHHMTLDRDVVVSLELLAASRSRLALQKALASNTHSMQGRSLGGAAAMTTAAAHGPTEGGDAANTQDDVFSTQRSKRGRAGGGNTAKNKLLQAAGTNKSSSSLFGFLNYTCTSCGSRLLRTNLLQPLTDINTLQLRLDSLQDLLESPHLTLELMSLMEMLPKNLDAVCTSLAIRPREGASTSSRDPSQHLGRLVSSVILVRDVLRCLPVMADSMGWVDSALLKAIRANFASEELKELLTEVEAVLDDDAQASKSQFVNRVNQCYAVRAQVDSLLDVSRGNFNRLTEAIHELASEYRSSTGISTLKATYSSSKGFYLLVPNQHAVAVSGAQGPEARNQAGSRSQQGPAGNTEPQLPRSFMVLEKRGRFTTCVTTHELNALNSRLRDAVADCILLTVQVMEQLVAKLLSRMPLLLCMLDNIALLDMLLSFFQAVTGSDGDWCRPVLSPSGPLVITRGRHPLLQALYKASGGAGRECVPNDTYISPAATLHFVTGPNMSGKSTYLKQVALLVILAQIGCYVPAAFMAISPYDSVHTRIGTADSIESNASSFMVEMADMAHLMDRAGPRSLIIIDELGRATSTSDGVALCWAMSEYLLALGAHTLLATHFRQLDDLAAVHPTAKLWRMQVGVNSNDIDFKWSVEPHLPSILSNPLASSTAAADTDASNHYGIMLARMAGLPTSITTAALQIAQRLEVKQQQLQQQQEGNGSLQQLRQVYSLVHKLGCVARQAAMQGLLPVDAAGQPAPPGGAGDGQDGSDSGSMQAALSRCMQMVRLLKQDAERLLLAEARLPCGA